MKICDACKGTKVICDLGMMIVTCKKCNGKGKIDNGESTEIADKKGPECVQEVKARKNRRPRSNAAKGEGQERRSNDEAANNP